MIPNALILKPNYCYSFQTQNLGIGNEKDMDPRNFHMVEVVVVLLLGIVRGSSSFVINADSCIVKVQGFIYFTLTCRISPPHLTSSGTVPYSF